MQVISPFGNQAYLEGDCLEATEAGKLGDVDGNSNGTRNDQRQGGTPAHVVVQQPRAADHVVHKGAHHDQRPALQHARFEMPLISNFPAHDQDNKLKAAFLMMCTEFRGMKTLRAFKQYKLHLPSPGWPIQIVLCPKNSFHSGAIHLVYAPHPPSEHPILAS